MKNDVELILNVLSPFDEAEAWGFPWESLQETLTEMEIFCL